MTSNKGLIFKAVPDGVPVVGKDLAVEEHTIDLDTPPTPNGIIVEVLYASLDPYLRGKMRTPDKKSYTPAFVVGEPFDARGIGRVLSAGSNSGFAVGDEVFGFLAIAEYVRVDDVTAAALRKISNPHGLDLSLFLGPLGMTGLTGYSSLYKDGKPKKGETIFVSSAAGAVGQIVGQIAKLEGLTVIGSVGSDEKLDWIVNELGFDGGFNYKKESPLDALPRLAPQGIDIYYENVGGDHLEAALEAMNTYGRVCVCGMISTYNTPPEKHTPVKGLVNIVRKQITMKGFIVRSPEYGPAYHQEHQERVGRWLAEGSIKGKMSVTEGIDGAAEAFVGMLEGRNFGKAVVKIR
jgi:hypothetical protein